MPLPYPNSHQASHGQSARYTKTYLTRDNQSDDQHTSTQQINKRILEATQSYNRSPKPFVKQTSLQPQQASRHSEFLSKASNSLQVEDTKQQGMSTSNMMGGSGLTMSTPKYNSPIDLYSMQNIRRTIEAHSEMIAPGVKGINFMKGDAPINKDSQVLKLIKEEEQEQRRCGQQKNSSGQQAVIGLPYTSQSSSGQSDHLQHKQQQVQYVAEQVSQQQQQSTSQQQQMRSILKQQGQVSSADTNNNNQQQPKCFECGQPIVGPFAKLQDRFIHPQCFNCSTCGTSLKNVGYYTIAEKLYCDIHARQVANVMRLNFNFEPNKQAVVSNQQQISEHPREEPRTQQVLVQQTAPTVGREQPSIASVLEPNSDANPQQALRPVVVQQAANVGQENHCSHCCAATSRGQSTGATTIATMFSGLGHHHCQLCNDHCSCNRRSEIRWTWRPANNHNAAVDSTAGTCSHHQQTEHSMSSAAAMSSKLSEQRNRYESRLMASSLTSAESGSRVPICCHCNNQIFGPYILAGKSTWCKPCSQSSFVCNSCHRSLLSVGFIEENQTGRYNCEHCFETYLAPMCSKCNTRIRGDCLNALGKQWHPNCFVCGHCRSPFGNSSFYLENNVPYCERDWNLLFTTKCYSCNYPIEVGDKWIEALERNYHSDCFRCTGCQVKLEGTTFFCRAGKPYCRMHAR